jgi:hypothetical protein
MRIAIVTGASSGIGQSAAIRNTTWCRSIPGSSASAPHASPATSPCTGRRRGWASTVPAPPVRWPDPAISRYRPRRDEDAIDPRHYRWLR